MTNYILDEHDQPQPVADLMRWALWFEESDRTIERTSIDDTEVSTVFLGIDHNFSGVGPPVLFETLIFGGVLDGEMARYVSADEARAGHARLVECVRNEKEQP